MAVTNIIVGERPQASNVIPIVPGMRTDVSGLQVKNVILLSLPDDEYSMLRPHLEFVELPHHTIMHEPGEKIEYGYFLNEGMTSLVVLTSDGRSVEVGIVGREGVVGTPLAVGLHRGPCRAIMQIPGAGVRVKAGVLQDILLAAPTLQMAMSRYALMQGLQVAQIAACNRLHEIEQRLARWLLMCQDRVDSQLLHLTQDFMAQMLGTGRPTVSLAAGILQRAGLIQNSRGTVKILNRKSLEGAACECYGVIQHFNGGLGLK